MERRQTGTGSWWAGPCCLLFAYFSLFWHTADIALLEDWDFPLFLFAETGPVLLLFATQIMLGALAAAGPEGARDFQRPAEPLLS